MGRVITSDNQELNYEHRVDADGNPAGGMASAIGMCISWQRGPLGYGDDRKKPNGVFMSTVIDALIDRLHFHQSVAKGQFACQEFEEAIKHLNEALAALRKRTERRRKLGIEGTSPTKDPANVLDVDAPDWFKDLLNRSATRSQTPGGG